MLHRCFTTAAKAAATGLPKPSRKPQLEQVSDVLIPGPYLRYFRPKKTRAAPVAAAPQDQHLATHKEAARPMYEYDVAPTVSQERMAQRIHRALHTVYAVEPLPTHLVTQTAMTIRDIKVARNLRACRIFYEPTSTNKAEQARVEKAMDQHGLLLAKLVKEHALLRRPISIKFALASEEKRRLDDIYDQLEQQLRDE